MQTSLERFFSQKNSKISMDVAKHFVSNLNDIVKYTKKNYLDMLIQIKKNDVACA